MALGKQIRRYREKAGLTLENLSDLSNVEVGTLSALEIRDSKRSQFVQDIAAALGLTVEQLMDEGADFPLKVAEPTPLYGAKGAATGAPVPISAAQRPSLNGNTSWPFMTPLQRILELSERDIGRIDGFMEAVVLGAMSTRKSAG